MKRILILVSLLVAFFNQSHSTEATRQPFIELLINGKVVQNGSEIEVNKGDRFKLIAQIKGGRADFVRFPDTYADFDSETQIISRGYNKLVYTKNGVEHRWEVISEDVQFESDNKIKLDINSNLVNKHLAEVFIPASKVEKSYIKIKIKTIWGHQTGATTTAEEQVAEAVIHLDILGNTNEWFARHNVKASGTKDPVIEEKLDAIQDAYLSIESRFTAFDFASVQGEIKNLQNYMGELETRLKTIVAEDPTKHSDITFIGLPSDKTVGEIDDFKALAEDWNELEALLIQQQAKFDQLKQANSSIKKQELMGLIKPFIKWQKHLPITAEPLLQTYAQNLNWNKVNLLTYFSFNPEEDRINDVDQAQADFQNFLDERQSAINDEKQKINYALTRLQAVRIFDGMLKGYFSSINFAKWDNKRN
ncbi:hypothetical protein ACRTDU_12345 [Sunxiuqinia elliptica]